MLPIQYHELKPPKYVYYILILLAVVNYIIVIDQGSITKKEYAVLAISAFLIIWSIFSLQRLKIIIDDHGITNRTLFKEVFIEWKEITFVDIRINSAGHGISFLWKLKRVDKPDYHLNISGRKNMQLFARLVIVKLGEDYVAEKVKKFSENINHSLLLK